MFDALSEALPVAQAIAQLHSLTKLCILWSSTAVAPERLGTRLFAALATCTQLETLSLDLQFRQAQLEDLVPAVRRALDCLPRLRTLRAVAVP